MVLALASSLVPRSESWRLANSARSGGLSLTGGEQLVAAIAGRWEATLSLPVHSDAQILALRALLAGLDGRSGTLLVGPRDCRRVPWAVDAYGRKISPKLRRNPSLDGTPYADAPNLADTLVVATLSGAHAIGATTAVIAVATGSPPKPGNYFEIASRLYLITEVTAQVGINTTVKFRPRLRADAAAGAVVDLVSPVCTMRLADDASGWPDLDLGRFADVSLNLVEAF